MELERIVTLANKNVRLRFLALERSLRAVGCDLPLWVIPYDETRFPLPQNSEWWEEPAVLNWLAHWRSHPMMRKYQCLTISNFQFVDTDIVFLRDPKRVLESLDGFITSCGHWHNPNETVTAEARSYLAKTSTVWQKSVFNAGQFACSEALFSIAQLKERAETPEFRSTCLTFPYHDQPGLNLLVSSTGVPIRNLTLPPFNMQSTWAGDYSDRDHVSYWKTEQETPYLIHWAGVAMNVPRPINEIFHAYLTNSERKEWDDQLADSVRTKAAHARSFRSQLRRLRHATQAFCNELSR